MLGYVSAENSFHGSFETEITGEQSALLGGWACPEVAFSREFEYRFGKVSCLVCFGRSQFSRENVPEMTELEGFL